MLLKTSVFLSVTQILSHGQKHGIRNFLHKFIPTSS
jgi:hypothetical protein